MVSSTVAVPAWRALAAWVAGNRASIHPGTSAIMKSTLMRKCTNTIIIK